VTRWAPSRRTGTLCEPVRTPSFVSGAASSSAGPGGGPRRCASWRRSSRKDRPIVPRATSSPICTKGRAESAGRGRAARDRGPRADPGRAPVAAGRLLPASGEPGQGGGGRGAGESARGRAARAQTAAALEAVTG
jgi:hypothetical protein